MDDDLDPGHVSNTRPANAMPFVVALVGFVIVAVLAFVFLREGDDQTILRPSAVEVVDDTTVSVTAYDGPGCPVFERAQVDLDDERIFLEFVVGSADECQGDFPDLQVELPEPIGDREVVPGVGRFQLPCETERNATIGTRIRCSEAD